VVVVVVASLVLLSSADDGGSGGLSSLPTSSLLKGTTDPFHLLPPLSNIKRLVR